MLKKNQVIFIFSVAVLLVILGALYTVSSTDFLTSKTGASADGADWAQVRSSLSQIKLKVKKYKLSNGLTVLLHQDNSLPLVNYQTWYDVGAKDDPVGKTGMAHLFEHMMFRETKGRSGSEFMEEVKSRGINLNAWTSADHTVYHFTLPKESLGFIIDLEAERMTDLKVNRKNLKLEQEIVKEERLIRVTNNPQSYWMDLISILFKKSPYGRPTIGQVQDIDSFTDEDCRNFYRAFYAPNRATLVITGPIDIKQTMKLIKKHYSSIPSSSVISRTYIEEPIQQKTRIKRIERRLQSPYLIYGVRAPKDGSSDSAAMEILSYVLGEGKSSRLYNLLVEKKKLATSVGTAFYSMKDDGIFFIHNSLYPNTSIQQIKSYIKKELVSIKTHKVSAEELNRAKTILIKEYISRLKTAEGRGRMLGYYETVFNDYSKLFTDIEKYIDVNYQDILRVANKYLQEDRASILILDKKKEI